MVDHDEPRKNSAAVSSFMTAVRKSDTDTVRRMLTGDPNLVRAYDYDCFGATAMNHAANQGDRTMVGILLEHGADINRRSDWWAGGFGVLPNDDLEMAQFLIDQGAQVDVHTLAHMGRADELRKMLQENPEAVHARGGDGQFPLHYAADAETIDLLLDHGADLEGRDIDHESTAAHWQATRNPTACRHLVKRGAKPDIFMAAATGDIDLLRSMLNADPEQAGARLAPSLLGTSEATEAHHIYAYTIGQNATPLHIAAAGNQVEAIGLLLDRGADVNAAGSYDDCTPLHQAAWEGQIQAGRLLLERGADINRKSGAIHQNEPIGWATVAGRYAFVEMLVEQGAGIEDYHIVDAGCGERREFDFTGAPVQAFARIADLLKKHKR